MFISVQGFIDSPLYPVMIISYEMFLRSVEEVRNIKFGLVICDEAHRLKNTNIKTATVSPVTPTLPFPPPFTSPTPPHPQNMHTHTRAFLSFFFFLPALFTKCPTDSSKESHAHFFHLGNQTFCPESMVFYDSLRCFFSCCSIAKTKNGQQQQQQYEMAGAM